MERVRTAQLRLGEGVVMIGPGMAEFGWCRNPCDPDRATSRTHVVVGGGRQAHCERLSCRRHHPLGAGVCTSAT